MRRKNLSMTAALLLSFSAQAMDIEDIRDLRRGEVAGVEYAIGTKSVKLRHNLDAMEINAKLGYSGDYRVTVTKPISSGRTTLELSERNDVMTIFFTLQRSF